MSLYSASLLLGRVDGVYITQGSFAVAMGLAHTPLYLRFVRDHRGEWDALDQQDDMPEPDEEIVVGKRKPGEGRLHIGRESWVTVDYERIEPPPLDVLRDNTKWREWCYIQADVDAGRHLKLRETK